MLKFGIEAVSEKLSNNKMIFFRFLVKLNRVICTEIVQVYTQAHTQIYKHTHASTHAHIHVRAHTHIFLKPSRSNLLGNLRVDGDCCCYIIAG